MKVAIIFLFCGLGNNIYCKKVFLSEYTNKSSFCNVYFAKCTFLLFLFAYIK